MNSPQKYQGDQRLTLNINGEERSAVVNASDTLLHTLRRTLGLTGTKLGCENGDCGACTVQINGRPVKSCITLTIDVADQKIETIEGRTNSPAQTAFMHENGFQCGFCTPGFVMNADALVREHPEADDETVRTWLESNICRCTGYENIENAINRALGQAGE